MVSCDMLPSSCYRPEPLCAVKHQANLSFFRFGICGRADCCDGLFETLIEIVIVHNDLPAEAWIAFCRRSP